MSQCSGKQLALHFFEKSDVKIHVGIRQGYETILKQSLLPSKNIVFLRLDIVYGTVTAAALQL